MKTESLMKSKIEKLRDYWKEHNIELLPVQEGKLYRMQIRFIEEDATFKSDKLIACDKDSIYFNAALYAVSILHDDGALSDDTYNTYVKEIQTLYNTNQTYN